jgi:glutamate-1-semialdehyde 2,1-aminomutase
VTLGKIIGGGLPAGPSAASGRVMDLLAPLGPVYQAGTLSGNPLAMAAGQATVGYLREHAARSIRSWSGLEGCGGRRGGGGCRERALPITLNRVGSMWTWFFTSSPVTDYDDAAESDTAALWAVSPGDAGCRGLAAAFAV